MSRLLKHRYYGKARWKSHGIKLTIILAETTEANPLQIQLTSRFHWLLLQSLSGRQRQKWSWN